MRLSTLVLSCVMILCCTGFLHGTADRLRVKPGSIAALCPLLAAAGAFSPAPLPWLRVNTGCLLLAAVCLLLCRDGMAMAIALLFAACAGACGFGLVRSFANFYEPGCLIALPAAAAAILLVNRRTALLCAVCAPLFYAVCVALEGYYLFRTVLLDMAAAEVFDAQTFGTVLLAILWKLRSLRSGHRSSAANRGVKQAV